MQPELVNGTRKPLIQTDVYSLVEAYDMKYNLYYAHATLKAVKGKILRGNTGIVHLSIEMEPVKKKVTFSYKEKGNKADRGIDFCIEQSRNKIKEGPFYICCVCNRLLYRRSVIIFCKSKYSCQNSFSVQSSFDGKEYICKTCHLKVKDGKLPCQAVVNNMFIDEIPRELVTLQKLEQILIAQRIVFEKIIVMPKGQQRKIKGAICNVPVECDQTCSILPRPSERSGIIMLKLKRKLEFKGYVYFEAVRPELILEALMWLKSQCLV